MGQRSVRPIRENALCASAGPRGQANQYLSRIVHVVACDEVRGEQDALARLDVGDILANRHDGADPVRADREFALRRVIGGQLAVNLSFEIGDQNGHFDPHQHAAWAHVWHRHVFKHQGAARLVQSPGFHEGRCHHTSLVAVRVPEAVPFRKTLRMTIRGDTEKPRRS
jgi:hypothetical protein